MYTKFPVINFLINIQYGNCFQGFRCVQAEECWHKSLTPLMEEVRQMMGDKPVYISFDIDGLDPCYAPGTGENIIFFGQPIWQKLPKCSEKTKMFSKISKTGLKIQITK